MTTDLNLRFKVNDEGSIVLDKISNNIARMNKTIQSTGSSLNLIKWDSIVNLGQRAFHAGGQIYNMGKSVASSLNDIDRMSKVAGLSTDAFQKMTFAAKMTDIEAGDLAVGLKKLSTSMDEASRGTGEAVGWFSTMGISVKTAAGGLKPLDKIMGEIADKFSQWEDGPRKIAIAVDLFGKSGQNLIPYLNQGADGLKRFYEEAERLGVVLDERLIGKGSELEDKFKRIGAEASAMWKRFVVGVYEAIEAADEFRKRGGLPGLLLPEVFEPGEYGLIGPKTWAEAQYKPKTGKKTPAPEKGKTKTPADLLKEGKEFRDSIAKQAEQIERIGWAELLTGAGVTEAYFKELERGKEIEANLLRIELERAQVLADDMFPALSSINEMTEKGNKYYEEQRVQLLEIQALVKQMGWEDYASGAADAASEAARDLSKMVIAHQGPIKEVKSMWDVLGQDISSVWANNVSGMIKGAQNMRDALRNIWGGMADAFISAITKMITQWLLFGSITGKKEEGGGALTGGLWSGLLGGLGSALGGILKFQHGGIVTEPTMGIVGETPEAVIPLHNGKIPVEGGGAQNITNNYFHVEATDVESFERKYGKSILDVTAKDARRGGVMKSVIRNYG